MAAISTAQQTFAYKLFHHRFSCNVQNVFLTDEDGKILGKNPVASGIREIDENMPFVESTVALTIVDMAEIHKKDGWWVLNDPKDSSKIYEIIVGHINDHIENRNSFSTKPAPIEDLILLDKVAGSVYDVARMYIDIEIKSSELLANLQRHSPFGEIATDVSAAKSKHKSMADRISSRFTAGDRKW